jgi:CubicO group peptidase (beta-lactamase class C family)
VIILVILGIVFIALRSRGLLLPAYRDDIDRYMVSRMRAMGVPGLAVGIVGPDGISWEGYYGTYDGEHEVAEDTLFMTASVSKVVIVTAIMQLWEEGHFELEDDVNDYLEFEVRNPYYPDAAITFHHLMTHSSTIHDRYELMDTMYTIDEGGGDSEWGLGEFIEAYLSVDGQFYSRASYVDQVPGDYYEYSNYGAALLAHLVEVLSGEDYSVYCHEYIFSPLGMENSYFLLKDIPPHEQIASPFLEGEPLPHYNYPEYPTGSLRTTVQDLARLASFYLHPSADSQILMPATIDLIFEEHLDPEDDDPMGLIWGHMSGNAIGHTGRDLGVSTALILYPDDGYAIVVLMNGEPRIQSLFDELLERLNVEMQQ